MAVQNNRNLASNLLSHTAHSLRYLDVSATTISTLPYMPAQVGKCFGLHFGDTKQLMKQMKTYLSGVREKFMGRGICNVIL